MKAYVLREAGGVENLLLEEVLSDLDFVLDGMGGEVLEKSLQVVKNGGTIVSLPIHQFPIELTDMAELRDIKLEFVMVTSNGGDMNSLRSMVEDGVIEPHVSVTFPLKKMAEAHKQLESGRTVGKTVVTL